ncbi:hypothetical protein A3C23_03960 [Candidatus Roizmanbacteria bacterium RIFCSPHIGHO2_02_FULL_37_13b]|uniref:NH(3)-dependent NAD(+) synthetase n=1 Tax=Candidatus Roizmanbacteria bacterium RIFCSPLOWO2_02_FULL_36_11 TaxID=1802071 RepID=A0A1F7JGX5_9BACT|nr:MAG: hypothetical protein A3C23_03960 [Candidatus Roizmanbacteria bacterium RIFCSPHIGHO2_02_FULL_37_13b]OGK54874.1 MAG: hypothetical protein A3H78_00110 [Candidatus Roizmanbacteria bacterium RIFCSPLOWO2_02_FULL_36_11]
MFNRDYKKKESEIVSFIQKTLKDAEVKKIVIGLSGGLDSSTCALLIKKAVGAINILPVILPYEDLHKGAIEDVKHIVSKLEIPAINVYKINIQKAVDAIVDNEKDMPVLRKGNIMSRVRMIYLYDLAKKHQALVCGTENKSEFLLGYFTRFGDEASDFEPLRQLYKTEVRQLARHIGVSKKIIEKHPTAGLWQGQTDEQEFGFSYADADQVLHLTFDKKLTPDQIIKTSGIDQLTVKKVLARVAKNSFKHDVPKVPVEK